MGHLLNYESKLSLRLEPLYHQQCYQKNNYVCSLSVLVSVSSIQLPNCLVQQDAEL